MDDKEWHSLNKPTFTDNKRKYRTHIWFPCFASEKPFPLVSPRTKNISQNALAAKHNSSISSWHVCVNVSAPVSNRATERGKVKAPVIKQWDCADDPITLWIQGVEGLWSLTGLSLCYVNVSFYNISLHLHGSADCIVPFSFFFNSCQVTSSNTES